MERSEKDALNAFHKYKYASADSVYAAVREDIAQQGLAPWQDELSLETFTATENDKGKGSPLGGGDVRDGVDPERGEADRDPASASRSSRTSPDPQSMGAIRTYALKYWLRGKLLISTGEGDLDAD